jgi:hypothetical protein
VGVRRRFGDIMGVAAAAEIAEMVELVVKSVSSFTSGRPKSCVLSTPDSTQDFDELKLST